MTILFYCLQTFSTEEILKWHIKNYFDINDKLRIIMLKKVDISSSKIYEKSFKNIFVAVMAIN